MPKMSHQEAELIADCMDALITWRVAGREVVSRPSPEAKHWERECHRVLDLFPKAVQDAAELMVHRRAA